MEQRATEGVRLEGLAESASTATMTRRVAAWAIDVVLLVLVVMAGAILLDAIVGPTVRFRSDFTTSTDLVSTSRRMVIVSAIVSTALSAAYAVVPWLLWGASPAQLLLGLRVRSEDGGRLAAGQATARWLLLFPPVGTVAALADVPNLAALLWGVAPVWYLLLLLSTVRDPNRRGMHDRIAGTVVCAREALGNDDVR